jgi:hypothetical protein
LSDDTAVPPGPRRRFRRTRPAAADDGADETLAALHAEVLLLREDNSRLKAAQHQRADIGRLLDRARSVSSTDADTDRDSHDDDIAQLLVDGLVIRESLLQICQEIERSMVAFEAKLNALAETATGHARLRVVSHHDRNGHDAA